MVFRVLHADDSPQDLAKGSAIGLFIAMTPTIGVQMILALLLTAMFRVNKAIALAMVWISNPLTLIPLYYANWWLGHQIVQTTAVEGQSAVRARIAEISDSIGGMTNLIAHTFDSAFWSKVLKLVWSLGVELWIGSFLVGSVCAAVGYLITLWGIKFYRQRFPRPRFLRRRARDAAAQASLRSSRPRLREDSA
jgi:uncharacterized protein (DUF2062 family)